MTIVEDHFSKGPKMRINVMKDITRICSHKFDSSEQTRDLRWRWILNELQMLRFEIQVKGSSPWTKVNLKQDLLFFHESLWNRW